MAKRLAWRRVFACAVVITAFGVGAYQIRELKAENPSVKKTTTDRPAVGDESTTPPDDGKNPKKEDLPLKAKVFRLSHVAPETAQAMLEDLLDKPPQSPSSPAPSGVNGQTVIVVPQFGALGSFGGGGALGALGGGPTYYPGGFGSGATWRLTTDARTHSLVARGTESDLQVAADLVAVLDLPADKPPPNVKTLHAFTLRFADGAELAKVLQLLELKARVVALPAPLGRASKLIVVRASEEVIKEIGSVIEQLDVEVKDKPEKKPKDEPAPGG